MRPSEWEKVKKDMLIHLLIPKEYRVWCRPNHSPGEFKITTKPSEVTCANCLTKFRSTTSGKYRGKWNKFKVKYTPRGEQFGPTVLPENL